MRQIWLLLLTETAGWVKRKNFVWIAVLIVFMISTFSYTTIEEENISGKIRLGVANNDTSSYSGLLLTYFNENETFSTYVELVEEKEELLEEALHAGNLDGYLVVPKEFAESMIRMDNLPVKAVISMKNPTKALILRHVMEAYETYIEAVELNCTALYERMKEEGFSQKERNEANIDISLDLIFTALGKDEFFIREEQPSEEVAKTPALPEHYKFTAIYFLFLFFFTSSGLRVLSLRKNGLTDRLRSINISMKMILTAVMIPYLISAVAMLGFLFYRSGQLSAFVCGLGLILPWVLFMTILGMVSENSQKYLFLCSMIFVGLAILGGSLIPEAFLPDLFLKVTRWMPNRAFTYLAAGLLEDGQQQNIVWVSCLLTVILIVIAGCLPNQKEVRALEE